MSTITINIVPMTGARTLVTIDKNASVLRLKEYLLKAKGIPVSEQKLLYNRKELKDLDTLLQCGMLSSD